MSGCEEKDQVKVDGDGTTSTSLAVQSVVGKKRRRVRPRVLKDEDYVRKMTKIIRRDFFPDAPPIDSDDEREELMGKTHLRLDEFVKTHTSQRDVKFAKLEAKTARAKAAKAPWLNNSTHAKLPRFPLLGDHHLSLDQEEDKGAPSSSSSSSKTAFQMPQPRATQLSNCDKKIVSSNTRIEQDFDDSITEFSGLTEQTVILGGGAAQHGLGRLKRNQPLYFGYSLLENEVGFKSPSSIRRWSRDDDLTVDESGLSQASTNTFSVPALSRREAIAYELSENASKSREAKINKSSQSSSSSKSHKPSKKSKGFSAAGAALAKRLLG